LFFMLAALQPVITQRLLEASRKRLIGRIERGRKSRVVLLVHRQETMSLLGFPVFRYIDVDDSEQVIRAIHLIDPGSRPGAAHAGPRVHIQWRRRSR
jgi:ClpP class serine protease